MPLHIRESQSLPTVLLNVISRHFCQLAYSTPSDPTSYAPWFFYRSRRCVSFFTYLLTYISTDKLSAENVKVKLKVWTLAITPLAWVRLVTSSALQSRKWQLIGISQWCRGALCGHPLPALTDNWTHGAASRHTIAPISHTRPSPRIRSYYSFPVPLRVGGWVDLSTH